MGYEKSHDGWTETDTAFRMFLATVSERDFSDYEFRLWQAAKRNMMINPRKRDAA